LGTPYSNVFLRSENFGLLNTQRRGEVFSNQIKSEINLPEWGHKKSKGKGKPVILASVVLQELKVVGRVFVAEQPEKFSLQRGDVHNLREFAFEQTGIQVNCP